MRMWLALGIAATMGPLAAGQPSHLPSLDAGKANKAFVVSREQWAHNLHDKRIEASVAQYAADGEFIDPGGGRVRGTEALRHLFETITATYDSDLVFRSQRVEVSGSLAYDSGTYDEKLVLRASGKAQHSSGSYLTVYHRGKDGAWLIVEQAWTGTIDDAPVTASRLDDRPVVAHAFYGLPANRAGVESLYRNQVESSRNLECGACRLMQAGVDGEQRLGHVIHLKDAFFVQLLEERNRRELLVLQP